MVTAPAPRPGLLITFEGGDGTGKTTQIKALAELLAEAGIRHRATREPGGTALGQEIRRLLLHGGEVSPRAEALLYAADRAHHVDTLVRPELERGAVVVCDRYLDSSVAYQGAARSLGPQEVRDLSLWATGGLLPDLTILLDAGPLLTRQRTQRRGAKDRLEREPSAFHQALRSQFLELAAAEPERFAVIDAAQPVTQVTAQVAERVRSLVAARGQGLVLEAGAGASASAALQAALRKPEAQARPAGSQP